MKKQISWINTARTLCIIAIYLRHSEIYHEMSEASSLLTSLFTPFRVVIFFFISGYLFFKKQLADITTPQSNQLQLNTYTSSLKHLMFRLTIPTIVFATLIYIPKMVFHGSSIDTKMYLHDVWGGTSYWFTSALTVAQVILLTLIWVKRTQISWYLMICTLLMLVGWYLGTAYYTPFPWHWQSALIASFFLALGGFYQRYETTIDRYIKGPIVIGISLIYIGIVTIGKGTYSTMIAPIQLNVQGFAVIIAGIIFIIGCSKWISDLKGLNYIGKHSITFYFLSGVMPALFSTIAHHLHHTNIPYLYGVVALFSLAGACIATYIIGRYLPFLLDLRRLGKK